MVVLSMHYCRSQPSDFACGAQGPLDGSGYGYCALTVDGQTAIKTGNVAGGLTGVRVAQRRTIEGSSCRLPVVYQ